MSKERIVIVAAERNISGDPGLPVTCELCNQPAWLADTTIEAVKLHAPNIEINSETVETICISCFMERLKKKPELVEKIAPPTENQLKSVRKHLKKILNGQNNP